MYKICFYVPTHYVEQVKEAMFASGAGTLGNYTCCAWQVLGEGQFVPGDASHAFIGEKHRVEKVQEYKVEMICDKKYIHAVISALRQSHPYEEPAFQVFAVEDF